MIIIIIIITTAFIACSEIDLHERSQIAYSDYPRPEPKKVNRGRLDEENTLLVSVGRYSADSSPAASLPTKLVVVNKKGA